MEKSTNKISIAHYVKEVNDRYGKNGNILEAIANNSADLTSRIVDALFDIGVDMAEDIQDSLYDKERLKRAREEIPKSTTPIIVDRERRQIYPEILGWSIAVLASAWAEWLFTAKSFNPAYQNDPSYSERADRQAASANVKLALPYIRCSILDAMDAAIRIGLNKNTNMNLSLKHNPSISA